MRNRLNRLLAVGFVVVMIVAGATAAFASPATESGLEALQQSGKVTVGIANEIPTGTEDAETGEVTGEAPAIAREVLSRLGIDEMDAVVVDFGALIPGLQAGQFDMIAAGMFITPERGEQIMFSDPDYCGATAFAVPAGNPHNISDFESVAEAGITLAVISGAVEEGYALDLGVPEANLARFRSEPGCVRCAVGRPRRRRGSHGREHRRQRGSHGGFRVHRGLHPGDRRRRATGLRRLRLP